MISSSELQHLITLAEKAGAKVTVTHDNAAAQSEGRQLIQSVLVTGLPGCGPHPMPPIAAGERLRECLHALAQKAAVAAVVLNQAKAASSNGAFLPGVAEETLTAHLQAGATIEIDRGCVLDLAKTAWASFWERVTVEDVSMSTTQRSVALLCDGQKIEVFDNSRPAGSHDFSKKHLGDWAPWQRYTLEEIKPILVQWMARHCPSVVTS